MNQGLPADPTSYENAAILTYCLRWPLMVDPQGQGLRWIKNHFIDKLVTLRYNSKGYLDRVEASVRRGDILLLECMEENIDSILDPIISRNLIRKGKAIKFGDKEIEYHPNFRLIMQTRLANPYFRPEIQAQTTLINFSTTRDGLEAQLLAEIVAVERPDLEKSKFEVTKQQNEYKINLKKLEDSLLARLATAEGNFIHNVELVVTLERTVNTALEIEQKKLEAEKFSQQIDRTRELYRPTAIRACIIYFIMNDLSKIHPMYQFSLKAFRSVFLKAIDRAEQNEDLHIRIDNLIDAITFASYSYIIQGLFEEHKLIFTIQLLLQILTEKNEIDLLELDLLLRNPQEIHAGSPVEFLNEKSWGSIKALSLLPIFHGLDRDIEISSKRWKTYVESEAPELEKPPVNIRL
jgi:dynein heavy chain